MSSFTTPLRLEYIDQDEWEILEEFDYYLDDYQIEVIRVPKGFITDFASIPRILWNILPPAGPYGKAAVIHDYLYQSGGKISGRVKCYTKVESDIIFREAMKVLGVGWLKRTLMYQAVKIFGRGNF